MSEFKDKILMCPPDYFSVDYVINPWMAGHKEGLSLERARQQWDALRDSIAEFAEVVLFLLSDAAGYITGEVIRVGGGR